MTRCHNADRVLLGHTHTDSICRLKVRKTAWRNRIYTGAPKK